MNHRIPRKKTASSFTNGDSKSNHDDINSDSIFVKQPEVAADIVDQEKVKMVHRQITRKGHMICHLLQQQ